MRLFIFFLLVIFSAETHAQQITGVWKGRIGSGMRPRKVELKLVQKGDSIYGTAYYYESANNYKRFAVKGFFDHKTNGVIWWDQTEVDAKNPRLKLMSPGDNQWLSEADFNCPGDGRMMLDGSARPKKDDDARIQKLHFDKVEKPMFNDEWDFVIENYMFGANDPEIIDSVYYIAGANVPPGSDPFVLVDAPIAKGGEAAIAKNEPKKPPVTVIETPPATNETRIAKQEPPKPAPPVGTKPAPAEAIVKNEPPPVPEEPELPPLERVRETGFEFPGSVLKDPQQKTVKAVPKNLPKPVIPETPPVAVAKPPVPNNPPVVQPPVPKPQPPVVINRPPPVVKQPEPQPPVVVNKPPVQQQNGGTVFTAENAKKVTPPAVAQEPVALAAPEIKKKFTEREKLVAAEIPITADSIELRFYDNAEVDGDSISLFLNNQLIYQHIRLTDRPYIVKLSGDQLKEGNELTMVAENLGAIPPNTAYMVVFVDDKRYDATLSSTEQSSAVVRFRRK